MEKQEGKEKVYCIFNKTKDNINERMGKAFEIYLKEYINMKEKFENNKELH